MCSFNILLNALSSIADPRRTQGRRYSLSFLLLFSILAILSGATGYADIIVYIEERRDELNRAFGSAFKRAPSINTVRVLLQTISAAAIEAALRSFSQDLLIGMDAGALPIVAPDGKSLRGSFDHFRDRKAAHVLTAFAAIEGIVLAQAEVEGKTNEIPCVQTLIRELDLAGVIYTGDAMQCQKDTFAAAEDTGSYVLAQVKANQPTLQQRLADIAAAKPPVDLCEITDKIAHGRQERRLVETFDVAGLLGPDWDGLIVSAARVTRLTWHKNAKDGMWIATDDVSFYACQTRLTARNFGAAIREHWKIESHHYVRDVSLAEDASRIRMQPVNFARLRSIALNILRANGVKNVARALFRNALTMDNVLSYRIA